MKLRFLKEQPNLLTSFYACLILEPIVEVTPYHPISTEMCFEDEPSTGCLKSFTYTWKGGLGDTMYRYV